MLLHCNAGGALFTVSFVSHDKEDGRGTDQHVDNGLQNGPRAQDHIHDIAVKPAIAPRPMRPQLSAPIIASTNATMCTIFIEKYFISCAVRPPIKMGCPHW